MRRKTSARFRHVLDAAPQQQPDDQIVDQRQDLRRLPHQHTTPVFAQRLVNLVEAMNRPSDADTVKQAFVVESLAPFGRIYDCCRYVYDMSLQKAVGYGSLKAVLQLLATEGLTASDVARRFRVTSASASDYLRWLQEVDLITERDRGYYFRDRVLRF
jgi:hypothetical protein